MITLPEGGSAAHNPDLDWSQLRETLLMLGICVAQIRDAMHESHDSLQTLTESFGHSNDVLAQIKHTLTTLSETVPATLALPERLAEIDRHNLRAITAFQFYDRLSQRLDHACSTICQLAELVADRQQLYSPESWMELQTRIRSQYSMEQEKILFDAILRGMRLEEALQLLRPALRKQSANDGEVELF